MTTQIPSSPALTSGAPRTPGETAFDWATYGGVGWAANVGLSIGAIWAADRTHTGKRLLDGATQRLAGATGGDFARIRSQLRYTSLLTGGFAVLAPIKWLEDHKIEMVKAYDARYGDTSPEAQAQREAAYARLENEPRQSWASVLGSRMLAMVPFYGFTGIAMKENQWLARVTDGQLYGERLITRAARGIDAALHRTDAAALAQLAEKNRLYPNQTVNDLARGVMERPTTALADYTITEATTSSMVAAFLYGFTRLSAPVLGHAPNAANPPSGNRPATPENLVRDILISARIEADKATEKTRFIVD